MIGHYLLTLFREQEDRVLTGTLTQGYGKLPSVWCLVRRVEDRYMLRERTGYGIITWFYGLQAPVYPSVPMRYDALCARFGAPRVNTAIRNRILSNRARRVLQGVSENAVGVRSPSQESQS